MNRATKDRIKRIVTSDFHLWITLATAVGYFFVKFLNELKWLDWEPSSEGLLVIITFCLAALLIDRLWEGEKLWEKVCDNTEKLTFLERTSLHKEIALRLRPETPPDYDYLWGGYTGNYYAYNPSYKLDKQTGESEVVDIFVHRYQNPHFGKAQYLFLTHDHHGQNALKTFRLLMAAVKQAYPRVINKIKVKEIKEKAASSAPELYLGERHTKPMGVMELKGPTLTHQHGTALYYFVIQDKEIKDYLLDQFNQVWNDELAQDVENFWDPDSS